MINRRMALFLQSLHSAGTAVSIVALPRHTWSLHRTEEPLPFSAPGRCRTSLGNTDSKPDIIFCFHWTVLPLAILAGLRYQARVVYDEHDFYELNSLEGSGSPVKVRLISLLVRLIHRLFIPRTHLVTCIHQHQQTLKRHLLRWNRSVVELHNYPPAVWRENAVAFNSQSELLHFVYIGGVFAEKGVRAAAEAFLSLPEELRQASALHVFGDGDAALMEWLESHPRITVHREITPAEFRLFAARNNCIGLAMLADTQRYNLVGTNCTKLYEYLALGMPVITTASGEIPEQMSQWQTAVVVSPNMDPDEIQAAMQQLLTDREFTIQLSANALRTMARKTMTWEAEWQKLGQHLSQRLP